MSYVLSALRVAGFSACIALAAGCAAQDGDEHTATAAEAALGVTPTITFDGAWRERVSGELRKGKKVRVVYDTDRLTQCRGDINGGPGWAITGFWRIGDGPIRTFSAGGLSPSGGAEPSSLVLDASGDLQIWFENTSRWGCRAFDSNQGDNYHFDVSPAAHEPGWVGNVRFAIDRMTCDGICDSSLEPVTGDISYDTWARQRAAVRVLTFEVWKDGVTSWDNPDLWKQLDVQVHSRVGTTGPFTASYVSFDKRVGNNARYAVDLRALDPIPGRFTIVDPNDCPSFDLAIAEGSKGASIEAVVELYATVNGVEIRPAGAGSVFRIRYANYKALYEPCL